MGRNGGGWAHYVGQEKCRPITGWISLANALDWGRPPRTMTGTSYWYMHTDQWRNDGYSADSLNSPLARGHLAGKHTADTIAQSARMGWMPFYPQFGTNPLQVAEDAQAAVDAGTAASPAAYVAGRAPRRLADLGHRGRRRPRELATHARAVAQQPHGLLRQGQRVLPAQPARDAPQRHGQREPQAPRPSEVKWHDEAPEGKLDLLLSADFRMTSTTLLSDIVLPAATWYEKHDLSSTDMHPFVHAFTPAIDPPWEAKSDFELFHLLAEKLSDLARTHLGVRQGPGQRAAHARHPRRDRAAGRSCGRLARHGTARHAGQDDAGLPGRRARLHRDRREARHGGSARRQPRLHGQERHLPGRGGGGPPRRQERRHARRRR